MVGAHLTHDIIICTRNRPEELEVCLASVGDQTRSADRVWIVDASDERERDQVLHLASLRDGPIELILAEPNLPAQRNLAVHSSKAHVVHFIDDDTVLDPDYLAAIMTVFEGDMDVGPNRILGVGGQPTNLLQRAPGLVQTFVAPKSIMPGAVLKSGRGVQTSGLTEATDVDWLSGCCMSFLRAAVLVETFDESNGGYALGEDLELSYRIRQRGRLVVEPAARLVHLESPRNRWDRRQWARVDVIHRRRRAITDIGEYSIAAFWLDSIMQAILWAFRSLRPSQGDARATTAGIVEGLVAAAREGLTARTTR